MEFVFFLLAAFEAFTAVLIKIGVFWDIKQCVFINAYEVSEELTQPISKRYVVGVQTFYKSKSHANYYWLVRGP